MAMIIVGLGPGEADDLSRRAWRALERAEHVILRTREHPCVPYLPNHTAYQSCDDLYMQFDSFEEVYSAIAARVLDAAQRVAHNATVVYAVPGDPLIAEATTQKLLTAARDAGIAVEIIHGISFIEPTLGMLGVDALGGLQLLDALIVAKMHHPPINPDTAALLAQVYNREVASNLKLTLMNQYPDDFPVVLLHGAGTAGAVVEHLPLYEIDRSDQIGYLTALYLPPLGEMSSFEHFQEIIAHLRAPEGCPWDKEQTHESLRQYLIEEAYEVLEAIDNGDYESLSEELGDLLLQIVLHTQIAIDDGEFNMTDVLHQINAKMIRRHPHVFGETAVDNAAQVVLNWEALKQQEKIANGSAHTRQSLLDGIPKGLPALQQAYRYQAKAAKPGFDWENVSDVLAKVREEIAEIENAQTAEDRAEEVGDLLFAIVNWARWLGVSDPETALRNTNQKFYRRFRYIEQQAGRAGKPLSAFTLAELDAWWNAAKAEGL